MPLFLGVDAGGTTTTYVLADEHRELARTESGSIKRMRVSAETADAHLDEACGRLSKESGVDLTSVTRTCIGAAGWSVPLVSEWMREAFHRRVGGEQVLVGDVEIALDAAFQGGRGVLVLAGTGSNVAARTSDGRLTGAGGWGPGGGDEGSGYSIGRDAVRALFRAEDADEPTQLRERIPHFWETDVAGLIAKVNTQPPPDFAKLVPLVNKAADAQDTVALRVLREAGEDLAETTLFAIARVRKMEAVADAPPPPVAFAGSILRFVAPMRQALIGRLQAVYPGIAIVAGVIEPVQGALWRARLHPKN